MRAQTFSLQSQEELRTELTALLRSEVYRDIWVEHKVYDGEDADSAAIGRSYLSLLRASMVSAGAFTLEVEDEFGSWGYWDNDGDVAIAKHFVRLDHGSTPAVFPAVAVMDRLVMVPQRSRDAFDIPASFSYLLRPLDLGGVLLVDFADPRAIREAVTRIGIRIRAEIASLGRRHMSVQRIPSPDAEALAMVLRVDRRLVEDLHDEILRASPRLAIEVESGPVRLNESSPVRLRIRDESAEAAGIVDIQIRAPAKVMAASADRYTQWLDFSSGKTRQETIEFEVLPRSAPYCPLEVLFVFDETSQAATFPVPVILDVES